MSSSPELQARDVLGRRSWTEGEKMQAPPRAAKEEPTASRRVRVPCSATRACATVGAEQRAGRPGWTREERGDRRSWTWRGVGRNGDARVVAEHWTVGREGRGSHAGVRAVVGGAEGRGGSAVMGLEGGAAEGARRAGPVRGAVVCGPPGAPRTAAGARGVAQGRCRSRAESPPGCLASASARARAVAPGARAGMWAPAAWGSGSPAQKQNSRCGRRARRTEPRPALSGEKRVVSSRRE